MITLGREEVANDFVENKNNVNDYIAEGRGFGMIIRRKKIKVNDYIGKESVFE